MRRHMCLVLSCIQTLRVLQEQAAALKSMGLSDYESLKARLLLTTAVLTAGGSGIAALTAGPDAAVPFAVGGLAGIIYQLLLQLGADAAVAQAAASNPGAFDASTSNSGSNSSAGVSAAVTSFSAAAARSRGGRVPAGTMAPHINMAPDSMSQEGTQGRLLRVFGSAPFRLLVLSTAALFGIWLVQDSSTGRPEAGAAAGVLWGCFPGCFCMCAWLVGATRECLPAAAIYYSLCSKTAEPLLTLHVCCFCLLVGFCAHRLSCGGSTHPALPAAPRGRLAAGLGSVWLHDVQGGCAGSQLDHTRHDAAATAGAASGEERAVGSMHCAEQCLGRTGGCTAVMQRL